MHFEKWQGLGNDFIVTERTVTAEQATALCDRRLGIGGDGVLVVHRAEPRMIVFNADGSRPEMCGNGVRCVAGWLADRGADPQVVVHTDAGPRTCAITRAASGYDVRVHMGAARVTGELEHAGHRFILVDVGNPHAVCFDALTPGERTELGPAVESLVPGGVNVELVTARPSGGFDVHVFERGVGWTQACGTGACAVVAAAIHDARAKPSTLVAVHLPGGPLHIEIDGDAVHMRGPAQQTFTGETNLLEPPIPKR